MFVIRMRETTLPAPTELYGYGGFTINITPTYDPARLAWLEAGGVIVIANLRGGTELGEEWHRQGMLGNKQQVFDDLYACAEYAIGNGIATTETLGIRGRSNGGLLAAVALIQRPELFGAVVPQVPVTDMYRYQCFTAGRYWTVEYGDAAEDAEAFEWLSKYSPLHNVGRRQHLPTHPDHDGRERRPGGAHALTQVRRRPPARRRRRVGEPPPGEGGDQGRTRPRASRYPN